MATQSPDFQKIFESMPSQYVVVDTNRIIVAVTDTFLEMTGKTRSGLIGMEILEAFPDDPDNPEAKGTEILKGSIDRVLESRKIDILPPVRYDLPNADGVYEVRWFKPLNAPALNDQGEVVYVLHGAEDITAQMTN